MTSTAPAPDPFEHMLQTIACSECGRPTRSVVKPNRCLNCWKRYGREYRKSAELNRKPEVKGRR